jgi:hypothetical protein
MERMTPSSSRPPEKGTNSESEAEPGRCPVCGDPGECVAFSERRFSEDILTAEDIALLEQTWRDKE